jgi:NADH:ubiquinone oxidoreductase subunit E
MVDDDVHQRVKPSRIKELLLQYATGNDKGEDA